MTVSELFPGGEQQVRGVAASAPGDPIGELARRRGWCPGALLLLDATTDGPLVRLPMWDHLGQVVGFKLRRGDGNAVKTQNGDTKSKTEAGSEHGLFIPYPLPPDDPVAVVEGEADTAAGLSAGWLAIVGTAGANLGAVARTALQLLVTGRACVLFPHAGGGGPTWLADVGALLVNAQCEVRFVPADPKRGDVDERLRAVKREERAAAMRQLTKGAVPWRVWPPVVVTNRFFYRPRPSSSSFVLDLPGVRGEESRTRTRDEDEDDCRRTKASPGLGAILLAGRAP